jgi:hypothetical protein
MGGIGRAIAAVATGGLSEVARQVLPQNTYNTVSSIASGGMSDIVEQNKSPFTGALEGIGAPKGVLDINQFANDVINPAARGGRILVNMAENDVGGWEGFDQLLDVPKVDAYSRGTDQGAVDFGTRKVGDLLYDVAPEVSAHAQSLGTTIGGIVGAVTPVTPVGGAAIGSGIGSKIGAGTRDEDYGKDFVNAGVAAGTAYVTKGLGKYVGNAASKAGIQGGKVIGGAVQGAARGALGAAPTAYEQGSLKPIAIGAGLGGVGGAIGGAYQMYKTPGDAFGGGIQDPEMYQKLVNEGMAPANYGYTDPDLYAKAVSEGLLPEGTSMYSDRVAPEGYQPLEYGSERFEQSPFKTDYTVDPVTGNLELNKPPLYAFSNEPGAYGSKGFFESARELGLEPMEALDLNDTSLGGVSANQLAETSLWDKTRNLMGEVGKTVLNSNLGRLGQQISADGMPYYIPGEEGRGGGSSSEASVDTLMTRMAGAESAKKSKKAGYVEVLNPKTGMPFLLQDLGGYKEGEVPEQRLYT